MRWILVMGLLWGMLLSSQACAPANEEVMKVLIYTRTEGFRHDAMEAGKEGFTRLAEANNWALTFGETPEVFRPDSLEQYQLVVFLLTTGSVLDDTGRDALSNWVEQGGGLLTVHSGTDTEKEWPWFVDAIGARFTGHPPVQQGRLVVENRLHPATSFLQDSVWFLEDEWYSFDRNPRPDAEVLIAIDEASYEVDDNRWFEGVEQRMGDHPLVWCRKLGAGRVFQTALGHRPELYADALFLLHLQGAVEWTAGKKD